MPPTRGISCLSLVLYGISQNLRYVLILAMMNKIFTHLISIPPDVAIDPGRYGGVYQTLVIQLESLHQPGMLTKHVLLVVTETS